MHLPTHALVSWLVAEAAPLSRRQRALVLAAGLIPDLDALTLLGGVEAYQRWHRVVLHNGLAAVACAVLFAALGARGEAQGDRARSSLPRDLAPLAPAEMLGAPSNGGRPARALVCALLVLLSFHLHLLGDLLGSAGPDGSIWPIPYLQPFSARELAWSGQWGLASWQNVSLTAALLAACAVLGARRGRTLLEAVSARADAAVVEVLRRRLRWAAP